jgi:hypothetical protein
VNRERVYFTWPDRGLGYDCRGCGNCCKGLGIGLDATAGQVEQLVSRYPDVVGFLRKRGRTWTAVNPRGRCWFLDGEGLCQIEVDHGRAAKPASCRLFPFNRVFRLGSWMIVDFNSVICPLEPAVDGIGHEEVMAEIASVTDPAVIGTQLPAADPEAEGAALVERERAIAAACFAGDGLDRVWDAMGGADRLGALVDARQTVSDALETITGAALRLPPGPTMRAALLLYPSLRFNEIFGPRRWTSAEELIAVLPRMLLGWLGFVAAGAQLAGRDLSLQELTGLWGDQAALAYIAARWHEPVSMQPGPAELPGPADPRGSVRAFAEGCVQARRDPLPLGEQWARQLEPAAVSERVAASRMLEPLLARLDFGRRSRKKR